MQSRLKILSILFLVLAFVTSCNYPGAPGAVTDTPVPSPTIPATATQPPPPPTDTLPPAPPTEALPPAPPTATQGPPPPTAPPPTNTSYPTATAAPVTPVPRALFYGTFESGELTFRIHENSKIVIPKTVTIKNAACKEGGKLSDHITFEPPPFFEITGISFTMTQGTQVSISGSFVSGTQARGTITLRLKLPNSNCTIGPLAWVANVR